jgi:two-component system NarL family sensor kinase
MKNDQILLKFSNFKMQGWIAFLFVLAIVMEYSTPPPFVFGYLYIGPVLLAHATMTKKRAIAVTVAAIILTIVNLFVPGTEPINLATVSNRAIVTIALIVTAGLSQSNRNYQEALARQETRILIQQQLASLREDFASTLTHDLKTPLLGAIQTLSAFEQEKFGPIAPSQRKAIAIMIRSHQNTLHLVEKLLDVYRNDLEGLQLHKTVVDLARLADEAISSLTDLALSREVRIRLHDRHSEFRRHYPVFGDRLQLHRVFVNLLANGIDHSPRGGLVEITLTTTENTHVVSILDEGQGLPSTEMSRLFERFYQQLGDRSAKGAGLGLYLSRQIVEAHGGKIWATQRSPRGAIFSFSLAVDLSDSSASLRTDTDGNLKVNS